MLARLWIGSGNNCKRMEFEMANHLNDLLDACRSGNLLFPSGALPRWYKFSTDRVLSIGAKAICFDAGSIENLLGLRPVPELARLPFSPCWIEFETPEYFFCALMTDEENTIGGHLWTKNKSSREWMFRCAFICPNEGKQTIFQAESDKSLLEGFSEAVSVFRVFLSAINCTNVRRVEHKPDEKLQKARAKRGKKPLFSYWTLELEMDRTESASVLGGTHASPRVHLRRGHARKLASGKYTWVQSCVVGNKDLGMIHKDYALVN